MTSTQDLMRQRFAEACAERDEIAAKVEPLRQQRDDIIAKAEAAAAKANPISEKIKALEVPLFDLHNEIANLSRALGGNTAG